VSDYGSSRLTLAALAESGRPTRVACSSSCPGGLDRRATHQLVRLVGGCALAGCMWVLDGWKRRGIVNVSLADVAADSGRQVCPTR
jgi:hypothetical protein